MNIEAYGEHVKKILKKLSNKSIDQTRKMALIPKRGGFVKV